MHHTDHAPARPETDPPRPQQPSTRPSPVVGFFVALALALVGWGVFWLTTRDEAAPDPGPGTNVGSSEGIQLTDEEAISQFRDLDSVANEGIRNRDTSRISRTHTTNSPLAKETFADIRQMRQDDIFEKSSIQTLFLRVVSNEATEIQIREKRRIRFCFVTESGKDVSNGPAAIEQVGVWILRWERDQWLIHDVVSEDLEVVDRSEARCG